jgi:large subunit ribosomal protein L17
MRHAKRNQRLSRPSEHRQALLQSLAKGLVEHGQVRTTLARAKEAQRLADRLVTMGKEGSIHSRRLAYRVLQDRTLVKRLFGEIAPQYVDVAGGYTRVTRLGLRPGDGAQQALLALSRLPAPELAPAPGAKPGAAPQPGAPKKPQPQPPKREDDGDKGKGFLGGLRNIWTRKKKGSAA